MILREFGRLKVSIGIANKASGSISLYHEHPSSSDERTVPVLHILDGSSALAAKRRKLFEPRITYMGSGTIKLSGLEYVDGAWYAQEWSCDFDY